MIIEIHLLSALSLSISLTLIPAAKDSTDDDDGDYALTALTTTPLRVHSFILFTLHPHRLMIVVHYIADFLVSCFFLSCCYHYAALIQNTIQQQHCRVSHFNMIFFDFYFLQKLEGGENFFVCIKIYSAVGILDIIMASYFSVVVPSS